MEIHHNFWMNLVSFELLVGIDNDLPDPFVLHSLVGVKSISRVNFQYLVDPTLSTSWNVIPDCKVHVVVAGLDVHWYLCISFTLKRWYTRQQQECDDTTGPNVSTLVVWLSFNDLRWNKVNSSAESIQVLFLSFTLPEFRHSEVNQLDFQVLQLTCLVAWYHNIIQFKISMDNSFWMKVFNGTQNVIHDQSTFIFWEGTILMFNEVVRQRNTVDQLHHNIDVMVVINTLVKLYNVWMIQFEYNLDFWLKQLLHLLFVIIHFWVFIIIFWLLNEFSWNALDGILLARVFNQRCYFNFSKGAFSECLLKDICVVYVGLRNLTKSDTRYDVQIFIVNYRQTPLHSERHYNALLVKLIASLIKVLSISLASLEV